MSIVLAVIEHANGEITKASTEVVTAAKKVADSLTTTVHAVAFGGNAGNAAAGAGKFGAEKLHTLGAGGDLAYAPDLWAPALKEVIEKTGAVAVLAAANSFGKDLIPHVSALFDAPAAQDVVKLDVDGGELVVTRPVYAGKALATVRFNKQPAFVTIRPNAVTAEEFGAECAVEDAGGIRGEPRSIVTEILSSASKKLDVAEAEIIVSGGRGMGGPENWNLIEELAAKFGAATGASRAAVDAGWRPHSEQVGQTGKTVSPQLYIAVGISGAIQHLAGMSSSKFIVAINKDPEAPIFKVADYGIVGDLFEVVPKMIEELK